MMMKANFKRQKKEKCKTEKNNDDKRNPKYRKRRRDIKYTKKWPLDRERCTTITKQTKTSLFLTGNVKIIWDLE